MYKTLLCTLSAAVIGFSAVAQKADTVRKYDAEMDDSTEIVYQKKPMEPLNIAKINLSSFVAKHISLQYERIITANTSVALGFRLMPKSSLPFRSTLVDLVGDDDPETTDFLNEMETGGFAITPEFRYYLGSGYGKGFYIAPYLRYQRYSVSSSYTFEAENNISETLHFSGHYNSYGIGLMAGWQFRLGSRVTLDWWILGPAYTDNSIELTAGGFTLSDNDVETVRENVETITLAGIEMKADVDNTSAKLSAKGGLPAIRGFGLCLGVRF